MKFELVCIKVAKLSKNTFLVGKKSQRITHDNVMIKIFFHIFPNYDFCGKSCDANTYFRTLLFLYDIFLPFDINFMEQDFQYRAIIIVTFLRYFPFLFAFSQQLISSSQFSIAICSILRAIASVPFHTHWQEQTQKKTIKLL